MLTLYWCPKCQKPYLKLNVERETGFRYTKQRRYIVSGNLEVEEIYNTDPEENGILYDAVIVTCPKGHEIDYVEVANREIEEDDLESILDTLEDCMLVCNPKTGEIVRLGSMVPVLVPEKLKQLLSELP
jgi:hypothetical protein